MIHRMPLYRDDLDGRPCELCERSADHEHRMVLNARCHPNEGLSVDYVDGNLEIFCAVCEEIVAIVAVAKQS